MPNAGGDQRPLVQVADVGPDGRPEPGEQMREATVPLGKGPKMPPENRK
jgi:hypothetical protein